jgi:hypothetical protein
MSDAPGNIAELRQRDPTAAERSRRCRRRKKRAAVTPVVAPETVPALTSTVTLDKVETPVATVTRDSVTVDVAAIAAALALTSVSKFFGVVGMTAIFTDEPVQVTLMSCTLEGSKLALPNYGGNHHGYDSADALEEYFTESEAKTFSDWLLTYRQTLTAVEPVQFPIMLEGDTILGAILTTPVGGETYFLMIDRSPDYDLPFEVQGYFDIRGCERIAMTA